MHSGSHGNWVAIGLMGVLLLLASAVGRVTATNVGAWLGVPTARTQHADAASPGQLDAALVSALQSR